MTGCSRLRVAVVGAAIGAPTDPQHRVRPGRGAAHHLHQDENDSRFGLRFPALSSSPSDDLACAIRTSRVVGHARPVHASIDPAMESGRTSDREPLALLQRMPRSSIGDGPAGAHGPATRLFHSAYARRADRFLRKIGEVLYFTRAAEPGRIAKTERVWNARRTTSPF